MIDSLDKKTADAFPKKRGRPSLNGRPMTAAERKRVQRQRARDAAMKASPRNQSTKFGMWDDVPTSALVEQLAGFVAKGYVPLVEGITLELKRRAKANNK